VVYIAAHPWLWRLGWLPWQLTALSDVVLALALLRTAWIPRLPAIFVLLVTLAAVSIEQPGEFRWITEGVQLAQQAVENGDVAAYERFEAVVFPQVGGWAAATYLLAALGWTYCFVRAGIWNKWMTWLSLFAWSTLLVVSLGPILPDRLQLDTALVAVGNALGFVLLMLWLSLVTELVLRRARPDGPHGRQMPWRSPQPNLIGRLIDLVTNSRLLRAYGEWLPLFALDSDISDVIYVNYLVEAARLEPYVPWGLTLQRLGPDDQFAMFTHLTYRHGHFGPRLFGSLRRLLPGPVQSNWRIYVIDPQTGQTGVYFVTTAIGSMPHALLGRFFSEGLPMHVVAWGAVTPEADGSFTVKLEPGTGSAPDLSAHLQPTSESWLPAAWQSCFADYHAMLAYCVPQDRALSAQPWYRRITRQEIHWGIPLDACQPLAGTVDSQAAQAIIGTAPPVCFRVARVDFRFERELFDYRTG
jgi:hypothetical protein